MSRIVSKTIDLASQGTTEISKYITNIGNSGIKVHPYNSISGMVDQNNYTKIDSNGMEIWQEDNSSSIKVAEFGTNGATIGKSDGSQSYLFEDYHSLQMIDKEGEKYFWVSDLRDQDGYAEITETFLVKKTTTDVEVSFPINSPENYNPIITNGIDTLEYTYTEGSRIFHITSYRSDEMAITFIYKTASNLVKAYTFGVRNSFASDKIGGYSFVEGYNCNAEGAYSHAEGLNTAANGKSSHAQNESTTANYDYQTVIGKYNNNQRDSVFEIGNGSNLNHSNALTVDWSGNVDIAGSYKINGTELIDLFYPVGSYYETSDANFDPNTAWGGTWTKLGEGQVLLSAGSTYIAGTEYGGNTKSYTPGGTVGSHTLVANEIPAHTHGSKSLIGYLNVRKWNSTGHTVTSASGIASMKDSTGTGYSNAPVTSSTPKLDLITINATHEHTSVGGGKGHNHGFTGTQATLNVMQKSTAAYIWHRTA